MPLYFYRLEGRYFTDRIEPALGHSWKQRSFAPCQGLCAELTPAARAFQLQYHLGTDDLILARVGAGLRFDRDVWRMLVAEVLMVAARDIPEIQTAPDTLRRLLAPEANQSAKRRDWAPIDRAHHGSRDLVLGGAIYRPDAAGWNDRRNVSELSEYLDSIDPAAWRPRQIADLPGLEEADLEDELAFVRDWFPALVDLYGQASRHGDIIVCEHI